MHLKHIHRIALLILALLAGSLSLVATAGPAHAVTQTESHLTVSRSAVVHGGAVKFTGWTNEVGLTGHGYPGTVRLQRKLSGQSGWTTIATASLTQANPTPTWSHRPKVSAYYRLHFDGLPEYNVTASDSAPVKVRVARNLHDNFKKSSRRYYGKVTPSYARKIVVIQKSTCKAPTKSSCTWKAYKKIRTSKSGKWSIKLPVYGRKKTHFRAVVGASKGYLKSYSKYYVSTWRS